MRENWQDLFLRGLEVESDVFRLGDLFKESAARQGMSDEARAGGDQTEPVGSRRQASDEPTQVSELVVTAQRPDWLHRQLSRARYGLEHLLNGRPLSGEVYYGFPSVQPTSSEDKSRHDGFIQQRDLFHEQNKRRDHLQRNIDAARRDPGDYASDVILGTLKGVGQHGLNTANSALAAYAWQYPQLADSAGAINSFTGNRIFEVGQAARRFPTVQFSQPEALRPDGDIQNQWSYLGLFGGAVGTGAAIEAIAPVAVAAPIYKSPKPQAVPTGANYSVAYEARLDPVDWGRSHKVHVNRANGQLDDALLLDPDWAAGMEGMVPGLRQSVSTVDGRRAPQDWVWHHDGVLRPSTTGAGEYGFMQLTPRVQHSHGSPFSNTFHPGPGRQGGYSVWALPAGAPKRR